MIRIWAFSFWNISRKLYRRTFSYVRKWKYEHQRRKKYIHLHSPIWSKSNARTSSLRLWRETQFLNQSRLLIPYLYFLPSKFWINSSKYIIHHLDSRKSFANPDSWCELDWDIFGRISKCLDSLVTSKIQSSLKVKPLCNDDIFFLSKDFSSTNDRIKGTKSCIVSVDLFLRDSHR